MNFDLTRLDFSRAGGEANDSEGEVGRGEEREGGRERGERKSSARCLFKWR